MKPEKGVQRGSRVRGTGLFPEPGFAGCEVSGKRRFHLGLKGHAEQQEEEGAPADEGDDQDQGRDLGCSELFTILEIKMKFFKVIFY